MIAEYLDALVAALSFDRSLARRLRQEVEDHLLEAVAASPFGDSIEAERRAIANFGDPHALAVQFVADYLAQQTRRAGLAIFVSIVAIFLAMEARLALYGAMHSAMSDNGMVVKEIAGLIDQYAFLLSVIGGIGSWAYIRSRPAPTMLNPEYGKQIGLCFFMCAMATGALLVSVACDGVLTIVRLSGTELSLASIIPTFSMAFEIACVGVLVWHVRRSMQQAAAAAASFSKSRTAS